MNKEGTVALIGAIPWCDVCGGKGLMVPAVYDAKTKRGPWAYLCEEDFAAIGIGLGLGLGQRLVVRTEETEAEFGSPPEDDDEPLPDPLWDDSTAANLNTSGSIGFSVSEE